jgi:hypothetical protein
VYATLSLNVLKIQGVGVDAPAHDRQLVPAQARVSGALILHQDHKAVVAQFDWLVYSLHSLRAVESPCYLISRETNQIQGVLIGKLIGKFGIGRRSAGRYSGETHGKSANK